MRIQYAAYTLTELDQQARDGQFYFGIKKIAVQREKEIQRLYKAIEESGESFSRENIMATIGRQEKEKDWAVLGGLASGLAGGGAGIATAVNTQLENQQIRDRNETRRILAEKVASVAGSAFNEITQARLKLIGWLETSKEDDSRIHINIGSSTQELFNCLYIKKSSSIGISQHTYESIDGYLEVCFDKESYVVPLPYMGIEAGSMDKEIRFEDADNRPITSIKPLVLWTIETPDAKAINKQNRNSKNANSIQDMRECPAYSTFITSWNLLESIKTRLLKKSKEENSKLKKATVIWTVLCVIGCMILKASLPSMPLVLLLICGVVVWGCIEILIALVIACGISALFS